MRRVHQLSFTLFILHVSDPHTVRKTNMFAEVLENSTSPPPQTWPVDCRIMHFYTMFFLQTIHYYVYFNFIEFRTWWTYFWYCFLSLLLNFFVFFVRFVSLLQSYFKLYHSQTFAVRKAFISAFCGKNLNYLSWFTFYNIFGSKS